VKRIVYSGWLEVPDDFYAPDVAERTVQLIDIIMADNDLTVREIREQIHLMADLIELPVRKK
jgi:hypothetical protein